MITERGRSRQQTIPLDHRDHRQTGDRCDRVATEGAAVAARSEQGGSPADGQAGTDREAVAQSLGQRHDIGPYALVDVHQPAPGATHPRLHLVDPQQGVVRIADFASLCEIVRRRHHDTVLALDGLQHDGGCRVVDGRGESAGVAVRDEDHVAGQRRERLAVLRAVSDGQGAHRPSVEGALGGDDLGPTGGSGDLEGGLVGLGAGVGEEDLGLTGIADHRHEPFRQGHLGGSGEEVGHVTEGGDLAGDRRQHSGMRVAQRGDREAGQQIQVPAAVGIPHVRALTAHEHPLRRAERVHQGLLVVLQHRRRPTRRRAGQRLGDRDRLRCHCASSGWASWGWGCVGEIGSWPNSPFASSCGGIPSAAENTRLPSRISPS